MILDHIVIPTLGRVNEQLTYDNLPKKYKEITRFVVRPHEFEIMDKKYPGQVDKLPDTVSDIGTTRQWISDQYSDKIYWMFDDDIKKFRVRKKDTSGEQTWKTRPFEDEDYDVIFQERLEEWIDKGYNHGAMTTAWFVPEPKYFPTNENIRFMTNVYVNGPKIPNSVRWDRCTASEDFDYFLQLMSLGEPNIVTTEHYLVPKDTAAKGGCSDYRTIDTHNEDMKKLKELHPNYVELYEDANKSGEWSGIPRLKVRIAGKRAYQDGKAKKEATDITEVLF